MNLRAASVLGMVLVRDPNRAAGVPFDELVEPVTVCGLKAT